MTHFAHSKSDLHSQRTAIYSYHDQKYYTFPSAKASFLGRNPSLLNQFLGIVEHPTRTLPKMGCVVCLGIWEE